MDTIGVSMTVETNVLKAALQCVCAVNGRYALENVCFRFQGKTRHVEATDGKKLFRATWTEQDVVPESHYLVSHRHIRALLGRFTSTKQDQSRNLFEFKSVPQCCIVHIKHEAVSITLPLGEGRYPKTDEIFPRDTLGFVPLEASSFSLPMKALQTVIGSAKERRVCLSLPKRRGGAITMSHTTESGMQLQTVIAPLSGEHIEKDKEYLYNVLEPLLPKPTAKAEEKPPVVSKSLSKRKLAMMSGK